jgi:hypothetical protein
MQHFLFSSDPLLLSSSSPCHLTLTTAGSLPTGKSKQRKTAASRRHNSDSSQRDDDSSDPLFIDEQPLAPKHVKKAAPKSRKSEPIMRMAKADEYEEDEGRMESQSVAVL